MKRSARIIEGLLAAVVGVGYVLAAGPLTVVAASLYMPMAQAAYDRGWITRTTLAPVLYVSADLVTALCIAIPFGVLLGLLIRSSLLSCLVAFMASAILTSVGWVAIEALRGTLTLFPDPRPLGIAEALTTLVFHRDFWLFPLAAAAVTWCVWRWRVKRSNSIVQSAP
jgi:hypothetical protein